MNDNTKPDKRRNKFAGKEDISRATTDGMLSTQIDRLREISRTIDDATARLQESINVLYNKQIPVNTERFEQLNRHFIAEMEHKLRKVKRPSKGLVWYIVMWAITLASGWLGMHFADKSQDWKKEATYWYRQYENAKEPGK